MFAKYTVYFRLALILSLASGFLLTSGLGIAGGAMQSNSTTRLRRSPAEPRNKLAARPEPDTLQKSSGISPNGLQPPTGLVLICDPFCIIVNLSPCQLPPIPRSVQ